MSKAALTKPPEDITIEDVENFFYRDDPYRVSTELYLSAMKILEMDTKTRKKSTNTKKNKYWYSKTCSYTNYEGLSLHILDEIYKLQKVADSMLDLDELLYSVRFIENQIRLSTSFTNEPMHLIIQNEILHYIYNQELDDCGISDSEREDAIGHLIFKTGFVKDQVDNFKAIRSHKKFLRCKPDGSSYTQWETKNRPKSRRQIARENAKAQSNKVE